jgi:cell wall-associated NlpC family hydrolase
MLALGCLLAGCAGTESRNGPPAAAPTFELEGRRAEVVVAALSQVGTPYVYGGSTPGKALDCSALTRFAHRAAGLEIPRVSTAQQAAAEPRRGRPYPGDLVFFKTGPGQYHVGIMVDRRRFVHASTSKRRVRLAHLDGDYWQRRYIGAGTYLN